MGIYLLFGLTAGVLQVYSGVQYIRDMLLGATRPNIVSQIVWGTICIIIVSAQLSTGFSWSVIVPLVSAINTFIVILLCRRGYGYMNYTLVDAVSFIFALIAVVAWQMTSNPVWALVFSIGADFAALVPTIRKTYQHPFSESAISWILGMLSCLFGFLGTADRTFTHNVFVVYGFVADAIFIIGMFILRSKRVRE